MVSVDSVSGVMNCVFVLVSIGVILIFLWCNMWISFGILKVVMFFLMISRMWLFDMMVFF